MTEKIKAYESACPGSMFEQADGGFVLRADPESLAAALLALVKSGDRATEDANGRIEELVNQRDKLLTALKVARQWIGDGEFSDGLHHDYWTPEYKSAVSMVDDAIAELEAAL